MKYWKYPAHPDPHIYDQFVENESENVFKSESLDVSVLTRWVKMNAETCEYQLNNEKLMSDIRESQFDIVFGNGKGICWCALSHFLKIPSYVWHTESFLDELFQYYSRIPAPPSFLPGSFQSFNDNMNLKERAINFFMSPLISYFFYLFSSPLQEVFIRKFGADFPDISSLLSKSKLLIANDEEFLDYPKPIFHKVLYLGGLGIEEPKALDEKWTKIMENQKYKGTILFSLGSVVRASKIPKSIQVNSQMNKINRGIESCTPIHLTKILDNM